MTLVHCETVSFKTTENSSTRINSRISVHACFSSCRYCVTVSVNFGLVLSRLCSIQLLHFCTHFCRQFSEYNSNSVTTLSSDLNCWREMQIQLCSLVLCCPCIISFTSRTSVRCITFSFDWPVFLSLLEESSVINNGCRTVDDTAGWLGLWGRQLLNAVMH